MESAKSVHSGFNMGLRVLGIDPGSKSIDLCGLCDGKVCYEASVETTDAARNPELVLEAIGRFGEYDAVAAPSGYGVEVTWFREIPLSVFDDWYLTFILLTTRSDIENAIKGGVEGARIYWSMLKIASVMRAREVPALLIPGVINLPTIPTYRKINRVDLGTADKLSVTVLGIHEVSEKLGLDYRDVDYIHVEMGYGYNAVIAVKGGLIVDGVGGSLMPGPAYLTAGALDLEVVQAIGKFSKIDVFTTGCLSVINRSFEDWLKNPYVDDKSTICFKAMMDSVVKTIYSLVNVVGAPKMILLSGRAFKHRVVLEELESRLRNLAVVEKMGGLRDARYVKETAQGYAIVADGLLNGVFGELVKHVKISEAKGTSLDYILIPRFFQSELGSMFLKLRSYVKSPAFNLSWWYSGG